jgi:DNA replication protein DnaC
LPLIFCKLPIQPRPSLGTFVGDVNYRLLDACTGRRSTALATNIDFGAWADYLGDPPLAAAFLDRLVDGAVILKLTGESYRVHRARPVPEAGRSHRT